MSHDSLLILDDDRELCSFVKEVAESLGFFVTTLSETEDVATVLRTLAPEVIFLDLRMPGMDGIEILRLLSQQSSSAEIILASGEDWEILHTAKNLAEKYGLKVARALQKPVALDDLESTLEAVRSASGQITETTLQHALVDGELVVHYQPKVAALNERSWRIDSVEALVRWAHPTLGTLAPDQFIGLAEQSELIVGLTDHVLKTVLRQLAEWRAEQLDVPVAVNLSPRVLEDLGLPDRLAGLVAVHGIDPAMIIFEITEHSAMADVAKAMDVLTRLRLKGFKLSVDDFGTGYSSLIQLYRMPFSEMKIDREFVRGLPDDPESKIIVRAMANLGRSLGMKVCVEGVESRSVYQALHGYGCDLFQGYYFSWPLPTRGIIDLLKTQTLLERDVEGSALEGVPLADHHSERRRKEGRAEGKPARPEPPPESRGFRPSTWK